jgi:uncharacterized protein YyaL (SSP411 family)
MSPHVPWQAWSASAFQASRTERKPVLLSLVTAWSEECAAMDATTFADADVVSLLTARFIPVRVDADRQPDINDRYNLGGWPTTAFLTSDGDLLSGGTYFDARRLIGALNEVSNAYRDRAADIAVRRDRLRRARLPLSHDAALALPQSDLDPCSIGSIAYFRSLLVDRFDRVNGGFVSAHKIPHADALLVALSLERDGEPCLSGAIEKTLGALSALWDPVDGGFSRYAEGADWSQPSPEKTLEDNAALLHVFVEAAIRRRSDTARDSAAAIVRWVRSAMSDPERGGFFNASTPRTTDRTTYVDRNAMMVGAFIRAAALFDDVWLRDFALKSLEAVIVPAYKPGYGVAHVTGAADGPAISGLLTDQVHVALGLIWAHAATGDLPYSMLAAEVLQYAIGTMWDEHGGCFRDRVAVEDVLLPFELNCRAAVALDRLAVMTGDRSHRDRAKSILRALEPDFRRHELFGAPYALAIREVVDRCPPAGLELTRVDWHLPAENS